MFGDDIPIRIWMVDVTKITYRTHLSVKMTTILGEIRGEN